MKKIILLSLFLSACTTPETVLTNNDTGQVVRCGGNVAYAGVLYPFMVRSDKRCVSAYQENGFKVKNNNE